MKPILDTVSTENMQGYLTKLTAFNNRYYKSSTGKDASDYIYNTISDVRLPSSFQYPSTPHLVNVH